MPLGSVINASINYKLPQRCLQSTLIDIEKFGYWKDTAIMLKGDAVKSFTLMFLQVWSIDKTEEDISAFEKDARLIVHVSLLSAL